VASHDAVMTYKQGQFFVTCLRVWGSITNTPADPIHDVCCASLLLCNVVLPGMKVYGPLLVV
jgi:hypothetical protein